MIDLKFLRENPDVVRTSQTTRGEDPELVDQLIAADEARRESIATADASGRAEGFWEENRPGRPRRPASTIRRVQPA